MTRTYDAADRLSAVQDWLSHTTRFAYDADGNVITQTYPASATAGFSYNAADQLTPPGIGVAPDPAALAAATERHEVFAVQ